MVLGKAKATLMTLVGTQEGLVLPTAFASWREVVREAVQERWGKHFAGLENAGDWAKVMRDVVLEVLHEGVETEEEAWRLELVCTGQQANAQAELSRQQAAFEDKKIGSGVLRQLARAVAANGSSGVRPSGPSR